MAERKKITVEDIDNQIAKLKKKKAEIKKKNIISDLQSENERLRKENKEYKSYFQEYKSLLEFCKVASITTNHTDGTSEGRSVYDWYMEEKQGK